MERLDAAVASAREHGDGARAAARRPRRLQGAQRHARPPRRRPGPAPDRAAARARCCASDDTLARLGGDEFAVVLVPGDETTASAAGLRLRAALEQSFEVGGIRVHIDASVGIALFPDHARDAARPAPARRRRDVRGQAHAHRARGLPARARPPQPRAARARRASCTARSRPASSSLHYQPKADARDRGGPRRRGAGALAASRSAACSAPPHFLPLVEQSGLTRDADRVRRSTARSRRSATLRRDAGSTSASP